MYVFNQQNLTNEQYYELLNTKVYVGEAIGITIQHHVLVEYTAQETFRKVWWPYLRWKIVGKKGYWGKVPLV